MTHTLALFFWGLVFFLPVKAICLSVAAFVPTGDSLYIKELIRDVTRQKDINFKAAGKKANEALYLARQSGDTGVLKDALAISAMLDWYDGYHPLALKKSFTRLTLARVTNDTFSIAKCYTQIGMVYLYTADYDSASRYHNLALENFSQIKDTVNMIKAYGFIGIINNHRGNYLKAKENLLSLILIKQQTKTVSWDVLQLSKGMEVNNKYYERSLVQAKKDMREYPAGPPTTLAKRWVNYNLGLAYLNLGIPDSALYYFKVANVMAYELGMDIHWNEEAKAYTLLGYYDSAIMASEKALAAAIDHGTRISQSFSYRKIGEANFFKKDYPKALKAFAQSQVLDKAMGHRYARMETLLLMAKAAMGLTDLALAEKYVVLSLAIAEEIGARVGVVEALKLYSEVKEAMGDYRQALLLVHEYDILWNQLHDAKTELDLAKMDLLHDIDNQKLEIGELNKINDLAMVNLNNRTLTMVIVIIIAVFTATLLFLNYLRMRKLEKLNYQLNRQQATINLQNSELAEHNHEKEILLGEIHHRVKNNLQVISSLLSMQQLQLTDESAREAVKEGQSRVQTMGLIHESLYQNDSFGQIEMQSYLERLVYNLVDSYGYNRHETSLFILANEVKLDIDLAVNIGLMTNELVSNSLKHAFATSQEKKLIVKLRQDNDNIVRLEIVDSGESNNIKLKQEGSFGLKLVEQLVKKYKGKFILDSTSGVTVSITLNINSKSEHEGS